MINCLFLNGDTVDMALSIDLDDIKMVAEMYDYDVNSIIIIDNFDEFPEQKDGYKLKYNGSEFYYEEIPLPEPTEEELINAEILLNQVDIITKQNEQDEVLAEILLNQMEV